MLKILQARLQQYVNCELPDVQARFRKGRGTRDQIANICWIIEKAREFQKNICFCFIDYAKAMTVWITINCGKLLKRWEYQSILSVPWETCMPVKKQQLEPCRKQLIGSRLRKEYNRAVCHHPVCLTCILSTSWEMQAGIKKGRRNINNLRYAGDTMLMVEIEEELKSLLMRMKEESERDSLKLNIFKKLTSWHLDPLLHGK